MYGLQKYYWTGEARCLLHAKVHLPPSMSIAMFQVCFKCLDMGSTVQDDYRKYPLRCIATVLLTAVGSHASNIATVLLTAIGSHAS